MPERVDAPTEPGPAVAIEPVMVLPPSLEEPVTRPPESSTATSEPLSTAVEVPPAPAPEEAPSATAAPEGPTAPSAPSATTGPAIAPSGPLPPDTPLVSSPTAAPEAPPPAAGVDLAVGPSYFPSLERFLEATAAGHQGICIVRDSPERIRAYVGSRPVEIRWLTTLGRGPTLKPADLDGFSAFLAHAVSSGHVTAFFLEGVEYLVRLHGLDRVIERMVAFDRLAREHAARVWVTVNPRLLSGAELERFVAALGGAASAG